MNLCSFCLPVVNDIVESPVFIALTSNVVSSLEKQMQLQLDAHIQAVNKILNVATSNVATSNVPQ